MTAAAKRSPASRMDFAQDGDAVLVSVAGVDCRLRASGALWLGAERALVIADLHLEKGSAYAARGQLLPPYDTRDGLQRLEIEIAALDPRLIVFLGDAFHDARAEARLAREDAEALRRLAHGRSLIWVLGNHDPLPPEGLPGDAIEAFVCTGLDLRHEPVPGPVLAEAAGHLHPCARVVAGGRSVRRRCFVTDGERLILPAFGAYAGGLNLRDVAFQGMFRGPPLAVVLGRSRAYAVAYRSTVGD